MFAILFEFLLKKIQEEIPHFAAWEGGGGKGHKNCEQKFCEQTGISGQRTEQVKTRQVNPDRPLVGPSVNTFVGRFVGAFVGSPRRAENKENQASWVPVVGALVGDLSRGRTRGATRGPTRGSRFAFACSVSRPIFGL